MHFAHHAHRRQDHDVDGQVGIEPEEVLEQNRVAAVGRVENPHVKEPLENQQQQGDSQHRRGQDLDDRRGVQPPEEQAARGTRSCRPARSLWIVTTKLMPVRMELKPTMNAPNTRQLTAVAVFVL